MKKLLMIFDVSFPFVKGGGQRRLYEVGRNLATKNYDVSWLTFKAWKSEEMKISHENISYIGTRDLPPLYNKNGNRNKSEPLIFLFDVFKNISTIRKYDFVWVAQWPLLHLIPLIIFSKLFRVNLIIDWWEVWSLKNWTSYSYIAGFIGFCVQQITFLFIRIFSIKVVTDNNLEFKRLMKNIKKRENLKMIPNGVPEDDIEKSGIVNKEYYFDIVSLGRLKNHKGVDYLIKSISILKNEFNLLLKVAIIGDGPERESLTNLVNDLGLKENIKFFGEVENFSDVYQIMKSSGICALTTHNGGGGNLTLLEAYGCGLPIVAFRVEEGIDESLIQENETGIFVESVDSYALAEGIKKFFENKDVLPRMKELVIAKSKNLSWKKISNGYDDFFKGRS